MYKMLTTALAIGLVQGISADGCGMDVDSDRDGTKDSTDTCINVFNPAQGDEDGDGQGDACDTSTPYHGMNVAGCFISDFPPLRGVNWEDRPTLIEQGDIDPTKLQVAIDWTASDESDWIESGPGTTNGRDLWFDVRDTHNPYNNTRTVLEGTAIDTDGDGKTDEFTGYWMMMICDITKEGDDCIEDPWVSWFQEGEWQAVRTNSIDCNVL